MAELIFEGYDTNEPISRDKDKTGLPITGTILEGRGERILAVPMGHFTAEAHDKNVKGQKIIFWDNDYLNSGEVGMRFCFVHNKNKQYPDGYVRSTGTIISKTTEDNPFIQPILNIWGDGHQQGREVLMIAMDVEPTLVGKLEDLFTTSGMIMGTRIKYLKLDN